MCAYISAKQYAKTLREAKDVSTRRIVIAMNKVGREWLEEIQTREPDITGELSEGYRLLKASHNNLTIEIYNNLPYAEYVEDGYQQRERWVPGHWEGKRFIYTPGEKSGMKLEEKWIPGNHIVRIAKRHAEQALRDRIHNIIFGIR